MQQAIADGSYGSYLVPEEVRELGAAGKRFWPRGLASLVHNESSILAKKAIRDAIGRGDNVVIDGTLSGEKNARAQFGALEAAGYDVMLADVETTQETSEARILGRWERGYLAAEDGTSAGQDAVWAGGGCRCPSRHRCTPTTRSRSARPTSRPWPPTSGA